jgi:hypothetical protein
LDDGDPLCLVERAARCARRLSYLIDVERVRRRAVSRIALLAPLGLTCDDLAAWIDACVEEVIEGCVEEDRARARGASLLTPRQTDDYAFMSWMFGLGQERALHAAAAFNDQSPLVRQTFQALVIEGRSVQACIDAGLGPPEALRERLRHVLASVRSTGVATTRQVGGR